MGRYYSDPKDEKIYATIVVKGSKKNIEKYLYSENERLNSIIDELEERIVKATNYINELTELSDGIYTDYCDLLSRESLLKILEGEE